MVIAAVALVGSAVVGAAMSSSQTAQDKAGESQFPTQKVVFSQDPYVNDDFGFQMIFPSGWGVNEASATVPLEGKSVRLQGGYVVSFYGPTNDGYTTLINVITDVKNGMTFEDYVDETK